MVLVEISSGTDACKVSTDGFGGWGAMVVLHQ